MVAIKTDPPIAFSSLPLSFVREIKRMPNGQQNVIPPIAAAVCTVTRDHAGEHNMH